jgi:hypothetical protein
MRTDPVVDDALDSESSVQAVLGLGVHVGAPPKSAATSAERCVLSFGVIGVYVVVFEQLAVRMVRQRDFVALSPLGSSPLGALDLALNRQPFA